MAAAATGGEHGGMEEGGEMDVTSREVMSTEGERGRCSTEECELGEGESSGGAGGGGRTKWNVREAIWICDLSTMSNCEGNVAKDTRRTCR